MTLRLAALLVLASCTTPGTTRTLAPSLLSGAVMSNQASPGIPGHFVATVTAAASTPLRPGVVIWRFTLEDPAAKSHELQISAPAALPAPLRPGDRVQATIEATGGGPNLRYAILFTDEHGALLLAVNQAPPAWQITRGPPGDVDRDAHEVTRHYGVTFTHHGVRATVAADTWTRMTVDATTYDLWGSGVQRRLRPGKRPLPDFVEAWQDFAIVRAR